MNDRDRRGSDRTSRQRAADARRKEAVKRQREVRSDVIREKDLDAERDETGIRLARWHR